ncbi:MAG TPA: nucleotide sugar dehydrogenase [Kiloniellales bacterium]|nr:nucleotide sugar dehydrogenase [Kiloniellales bacterium]
MSDTTADRLHGLIEGRQAKIGIMGLGYVGLPLARAFAQAGFTVLGFDTDPEKRSHLLAGRSYLKHIAAESLTPLVRSGHLVPQEGFAQLGEADVVIICVPTPLGPARSPDLAYVEATARSVAAALRPGQLVVLESTTYPGTTEEVLKPLMEARGLTIGREVFLAFSPEREDPGNPHFGTRDIPKVVGADDPASRRLAEALYATVVPQVVPVANARTAEAVKLTENIFRAVNIALVNELKTIYEALGIDIWEVIEAAKTKPFGFMAFYPGPGLGGHCIPIDPFYLSWKARTLDVEAAFIELAGEVNRAMPERVVARLADALNESAGKGLKGASILLLGVAYKKNVDDMRESPALVLIERLEAKGAEVAFHDPHVAAIPPTREHAKLAGRRSVALTAEALAAADAVLIATDHDEVDYALVARHARLVVDTRNAMARHGPAAPAAARIVKA